MRYINKTALPCLALQLYVASESSGRLWIALTVSSCTLIQNRNPLQKTAANRATNGAFTFGSDDGVLKQLDSYSYKEKGQNMKHQCISFDVWLTVNSLISFVENANVLMTVTCWTVHRLFQVQHMADFTSNKLIPSDNKEYFWKAELDIIQTTG